MKKYGKAKAKKDLSKDKINVVDRVFQNGAEIGRDFGDFDKYCVYWKEPGDLKYHPPLDVAYFGRILNLAKEYGTDKVYGDFCSVFDATDTEVRQNVFDMIDEIASEYGDDATEMEFLLYTFYLTMVAEENKKNAVLKKYIKRLGVHVMLFEDYSVYKATHFMYKQDWKILARLCENRGFMPELPDWRTEEYKNFWQMAVSA